jgi:predicted dehydrogenase
MTYALIGCGRIAGETWLGGLRNYSKYDDYLKMIDEVRPGLVAVAAESGSHAKNST